MRNVLVTGGCGYIGSILVPKLLECGNKVTVIDNLMYRQASLANLAGEKNFSFVLGDVRDNQLMRELIPKADVIVPLAAIVGAPACAKDPMTATSINKDSIFEMLSKISKDQQIIMPTTNSAYGSGDKNNFCDENSKLKPLSLYAKDKVEVEKRLMEHPNATSFRLATVFGISPRMRLDLLVNNFVYKAFYDRYMIVFEGHFKRNFIHLNDVAQAFMIAINQPDKFAGEIFNVGLSTANISKIELCLEIQKQLPDFVYMESQIGKDPDQRNYIVSNQKIESRGFEAKIDLTEGIQELLRGMDFFRNRDYSNV